MVYQIPKYYRQIIGFSWKGVNIVILSEPWVNFTIIEVAHFVFVTFLFPFSCVWDNVLLEILPGSFPGETLNLLVIRDTASK